MRKTIVSRLSEKMKYRTVLRNNTSHRGTERMLGHWLTSIELRKLEEAARRATSAATFRGVEYPWKELG